jgi:hypothetical protein
MSLKGKLDASIMTHEKNALPNILILSNIHNA